MLGLLPRVSCQQGALMRFGGVSIALLHLGAWDFEHRVIPANLTPPLKFRLSHSTPKIQAGGNEMTEHPDPLVQSVQFIGCPCNKSSHIVPTLVPKVSAILPQYLGKSGSHVLTE